MLLVLFLVISLFQYTTAGQVTWVTGSFRWIENSAKAIWVDPKGYLRNSAEAVGDYSSNLVESVAQRASEDIPVANPSTLLSRAEIAWSSPAYDLSGRVVKVADGDTLTILDAEQTRHRVRLHGIDTPEYKQPYGTAAKNALANLVAGEGVGIDVKDTDRYGRTVGVVYKGNVNINLEMVRNGYAWWYKKYAPFDDDLRLAQQQAQVDKAGLWADPNPVSPWEWRSDRK
jgi:endonuclease YncB( thermonuclease family)